MQSISTTMLGLRLQERGNDVGGPALVGRYLVGSLLGAGTSGQVFRGVDGQTGNHVAVKLFAAADAGGRERLLEELAQLRRLDHPRVAQVLDFGVADTGAFAGSPYLVTALVEGATLESISTVADDSQRLDRWMGAACDLVEALAYVHAQGVLHGDLCPNNVRLGADGRPVLLDFGLAGATRARSGLARGTLGFAAPEALLGERTARADLFALGACLFAAWAGVGPFGEGMAAVRRMRAGPPPRPRDVRPGLPSGCEALIAALLSMDPAERPASAREVLRQLLAASGKAEGLSAELSLPAPRVGDPLAGLFVGFSAERRLLRGALEALGEGACTSPVIVVVGPPGSGRRTLIQRALCDAQLAHLAEGVAPLGVVTFAGGAVGAVASPAIDRAYQWARAQVRAWQECARERPLCVVAEPGLDAEALARHAAAEEVTGRLLLLVPAESPLDAPGALTIALPRFGASEISALLRHVSGGASPEQEHVTLIDRRAQGRAAAAALLVRRFAEGSLGTEAGAQDVSALWGSWHAALSAEHRLALAALVLTDDHTQARQQSGLSTSRWAELVRDLQRGGWVSPEPLRGSAAASSAVLATLGDPALAPLLSKVKAGLPAGDPRRTEVLAALGACAEAARELRERGLLAFREGRWGAAAESLGRALSMDPEGTGNPERCSLATALAHFGRHDQALSVLPPGKDTDVTERRAWILARRGDLLTARRELEACLSSGQPSPLLQARLARVLLALGERSLALETASRIDASAGEEPWGLGREVAILGAVQAGELEAAAGIADRLAKATEPAVRARARALAGMVAQLEGRGSVARGAFAEAVQLYEGIGDTHAHAVAMFNLGCALADSGRYGEALDRLAVAARTLEQVGAPSERALALFNMGVLLARLGDLPAAERVAARLRASRPAPGSTEGAAATWLEAELTRRKAPHGARAGLTAAEQALGAVGLPTMAALAGSSAAEALVEAGRLAEAGARLAQLRASVADTDRVAREALSLAEARFSLAGGGGGPTAQSLCDLCERAVDTGRLATAWRAAALAAAVLARHGDKVNADTWRERGRQLFEEVRMATPERHHAGLGADSDVRWLREEDRGGASATALRELSVRAERAEGRLRRLCRINKRLNSELRLSRVLETIVDAVIEMTDAERGFLLLADDAGELEVKVARNIDERALHGPELSFSRSIAREVAQTGAPIVTVDAQGDERFRAAASVSDLRLRSVLAAPLAVKGRVVGVIYVDHRLRLGVFGDEDVGLVLEFAEQGALAIENARLLSELRRRERQVEALNRRLQAELSQRRTELADARQEIRETRDTAKLRYDYRQIVGRSPRMMELFRLLDRVTDTGLPVVIQGESGTGKELVARAIHHNGPRRDRPFVSENCAAIPETLLESTLFGYVRGAFTGAERDTRGLFAVANGGTLFLDEVGEMSPAMQGKLLRVLQQGEFRRVGGERPEKVDVRIVVATNRDLARMVEEKAFRQDLYFRLSVVRIELPPVRERAEDIPLLVEHFLRRSQSDGRPPKEIDPDALARLMAYRWPGNVRELENELTRAAALSGERITRSDLSPHIAERDGDPIADLSTGQDLQLRPRVERLERSLIREALARYGGNQTRAAEALGLSRFGLQKKLQRYRITI